jgi:TP901 family phage tail tape measure protein
MRKFGLAAILTFIDKGATAGMGKVGRQAALLKKRFQGVGRGVGQMRAGLGTLATAALPVAAGFGLMLKKGADFEQSMAKLQAVTLDQFDPALKGLAKTLGATTAFSASQAADAMTNLARAGLNSKEIMGAVRGTLNAAAAEGISLATAADMVASNIKAFNIDAKEASRIAGILALTSARTNTSMVALQEGLKLAAPAVRPLNVSLEQTSALLGALADIGLKGTLGGTAIRASVSKLLKPTDDARKAMSELGVSIPKIRKRMDKGDLVGVFKDLVGAMKGIPQASKRAELMSRILGIRGQTMAAAMNLSTKNTEKFNKTLEALQRESGQTAKRMKEIQLRTLTGQLTILKSAFEGVSIELFDLISGKTRGLVERMSSSLGNLALAMRVVSGEKITDKETLKEIEKIPKSFFEAAKGIREAFSSRSSSPSGSHSGTSGRCSG